MNGSGVVIWETPLFSSGNGKTEPPQRAPVVPISAVLRPDAERILSARKEVEVLPLVPVTANRRTVLCGLPAKAAQKRAYAARTRSVRMRGSEVTSAGSSVRIAPAPFPSASRR
jgi:hypothetical protein